MENAVNHAAIFATIYSNTTKYSPSPIDCLTVMRCIDCIDVAVIIAYFGTLLVVAFQLWRLGKTCDGISEKTAKNSVGRAREGLEANATCNTKHNEPLRCTTNCRNILT